ncbi:hypothetical protein BKA80DRAFT_253442 [Phyllosticta citrichinensis]
MAAMSTKPRNMVGQARFCRTSAAPPPTTIPSEAKKQNLSPLPNVLGPHGTWPPPVAPAHGAPQGLPNHHDAPFPKPHTRPNTTSSLLSPKKHSFISTVVNRAAAPPKSS